MTREIKTFQEWVDFDLANELGTKLGPQTDVAFQLFVNDGDY